ncbi:hypothetical protein Godav_010355 [Gossypium davidsonii]|uniref:Uncharacterized protein n=1 Tax=Gossypium davidsonii TaxID=34287 RepID=A0A7J8SGV4_GOSDV|nr:hypothetical protein [Gossypium davidsonii]
MHKSLGNKTHPIGTKNLHQQRNKEPAPGEEQRTSTSRGSKKQ